MATPTIPNGETQFFSITYEGNGAGQRVGKFVPFTDNGTIPNSLIFNKGDSPRLNRTPSGTGTSRRIYTLSVWAKPSLESSDSNERYIIAAGPYGNSDALTFRSDRTLQFWINGTVNARLITNRTFEDTSKFYHLLVSVDTTQSTSSDRIKIYVDGDQITSFSTETYPSQNYDGNWGNTASTNIGSSNSPNRYYAGYLAEVNYVDGTALTPDTFGLTDTSTGRWIPKALTGITYGTNGFRLQFGSSSALGDDTSGNTNDFSVSNLVASDQTTDSPTQNFATGLGGFQTSYAMTMSEGNLKSKANGGTNQHGKSQTTLSFDPSDSDGYYAEYTLNETNSVGSNFNNVGIGAESSKYVVPSSSNGSFNHQVAYQEDGRVRFTNGAGTITDIASWGSTWGNVSTPDIIGIFVKNNKIYFSKNGTWQGSADPNNETGGLDIEGTMGSNRVGFYHTGYDTSIHGTMTANFGQKSFTYTPPTGYKKLNQDNLPETAKGVSGFVWIKSRDTASANMLFDSSRGPQLRFKSDSTSAESLSQGTLTKFLKGGYAVGDQTAVNKSGDSTVAWNWVANGGTTASNGDGSITSTVQANTTAGFSIVEYTGNGGNAAATIGHGLSSAPEWMMVKFKDSTAAWSVYHKSVGATKRLQLNSTTTPLTDANIFNNTEPTSSVFSVGSSLNQTTVYNFIVYCWHSVDGFSKFGSYGGNAGSNGPFIYTGFAPSWVMIKRTSSTGEWFILDKTRNPNNTGTKGYLDADTTDAEGILDAGALDWLSNGFKLRQNSSQINNGTHVYMAFAEHPFVGDGTNPVTAR